MNKTVKIKSKSFLFAIIILSQLLSQNIQKEILPFHDKKISMVKFTGDIFQKDTLLGICQEFDARGKPIPRTSFLACLYINSQLEYEIIHRFELSDESPGDFTDFLVTDLNNDANKEIIALASHNKTLLKKPSTVFILQINADCQFSDAGYRLPANFNLANYKALTAVNQNHYILLTEDLQTDLHLMSVQDKNIVFSELWKERETQKYFESKFLNLKLQGTDKKIPFLVKVNSDLLSMIKPEIPPGQISERTFFEPEGHIWDIQNIAAGDFNGDNTDELVAGKMNGGISLISLQSDTAYITEIFSSSFQYEKLFVFDSDNDGRDDLVIVDKNGKAIKTYHYSAKYENFWSSSLLADTEMNGIQFLNFYPRKNETLFSYIFPDFMHHGLIKIFTKPEEKEITTIIEEKDQEVPNPFAQIDSLIREFESQKGTPSKIITPQKHNIIEIQSAGHKPREVDYILEPGMKFTQKVNLYSVASENLNYSINAPEGMRFSLVERSFIWQPTPAQIGFHKVSAIFYWDDVEIKKDFTIYVNDKIEIINKLPERNIIQAGEIFQYQLDIKDRNSDNSVQYRLIKYPEGTTLNKQGFLTWKPGSHQQDWYDFELTVSDGYSEDQLFFSIFVNYPVKINQQNKINLTLGKTLDFPIAFEDKNTGFYLSQYNLSPKIDNWRQSGIYETLILTNQTKQALPEIIEKLKNQPIQTDRFCIQEVLFEQNKLVLLFTYENDDIPSFSEVFTAFFETISMAVPNHTSYITPQFYKYTLKNSPAECYITKEGFIRWKPEAKDLGQHQINYTVSDGYYSDEGHLEIFVNDPPRVVSTAKPFANIDETYTYQLKISDKNIGENFTYSLKESPANARIDENGQLFWQVKENSDGNNFFKIAVSDGRDTTFHEFAVQINQKPVITSREKLYAKTGRLFEYQIKATDPEGKPLFYRAIKLPESANFDNTKGLLFWKPDNHAIGNHEIIVEVKDQEGNIAFDEFTISVVKSRINLKTLSLLSGTLALATMIIILAI